MSVLKSPYIILLQIIIGLVFGVGVSLYFQEERFIVGGASLILLSFCSLLIQKNFGLLAKCLLSIGVLLPFLAGLLKPIFYPSSDYFSWDLLGMFVYGLLPGLVIFLMGLLLFVELDRADFAGHRYSYSALMRNSSDVLIRIYAGLSLFLIFTQPHSVFFFNWVYGALFLVWLALIFFIPRYFNLGIKGIAGVLIILGAFYLGIIWALSWLGNHPLESQEIILAFTGLSVFLGFLIYWRHQRKIKKQEKYPPEVLLKGGESENKLNV